MIGLTVIAPAFLIHRHHLFSAIRLRKLLSWEIAAQVGSVLLSIWLMFFWQDPIIEAPEPAHVRAVTVTFEPGAVIPFAETHVMEHGLYVLEGKAVYRLNNDWVEVEAGDFMWLRAFCPQACYAGGPGRFRYLLYKDVNRHMKLKSPFAR